MRRQCFGLILLFVCFVSLLVVAGCGGSGSALAPAPSPTPQFPPAPTTFNNASMNGSYVLSASGANPGGFFTIFAPLPADGKGGLGLFNIFFNGTVNGVRTIGSFPASGMYNIAADGSTIVTLGAPQTGTSTFDAVLTSPQHGLAARFDNAGTASGRIDLQDPSAFTTAALAGTFAFNFSGLDASGNPEASVGALTFDSNGNITSGSEDINDGGAIQSNLSVVPGPLANITLAPGVGHGVLTFTTNDGVLHEFGCFVVDANHIRIEGNDSNRFNGDLFRVASTAISGSYAFILDGTSSGGAFAAGGIINTDGTGNILNTSVADSNNGGSLALNSGLSGTYSLTGNRATVTLNGGAINLVAYPSSGGLQLVEMDPSTVAGGVALQQAGAFSNASLNSSFAANLFGADAAGHFDAVSRFSADGAGHLLGTLNLNDNGTLTAGLVLNGSYNVAANGRAPGTLVTSAGTLNVIFYLASGSQALFIETDTNRVSQGTVVGQ